MVITVGLPCIILPGDKLRHILTNHRLTNNLSIIMPTVTFLSIVYIVEICVIIIVKMLAYNYCITIVQCMPLNGNKVSDYNIL